MSGICGAWAFGGDHPELRPMLDLLERRGPEGTRSWAEGSVGLGHSLLATTPEALVETLPLTDGGSGCTITADARIDNRDELIAALDLDGGSRTIGDGELILNAYLKWGDDCPVHLLGDFAFAIWDPREPRLFCARDHMGMRQLIYHHAPGRLFAFATEAEALVANAGVPKRINHGRIADFLDDLEAIDFTSTFFEEVFRLAPAHRLSVSTSGLALGCYWTLHPGPELRLDSDQAYANAFLDVFKQAVRCRLRSAKPVGLMLSGGLDSNSIAAVAGNEMAAMGRGPLRTFSAVGPDDADHESDAIATATRSPQFSSTLVRPDEIGEEALQSVRQCAEPFDAYLVINRALYAAARRSGINVMLDGAGADVVLTAGNRVAALLGQGKIIEAAREARSEAEFWGPAWPTPKIFLPAAWASVAPAWVRRVRRRVAWWIADTKLGMGRTSVSRDLARAVNQGERRSRARRHLPTDSPADTAYRAQSIRHPNLAVARERYDRTAASFGVEARDPFMDIRLIQFALSLPSVQLQTGGWPKTVVRRAMTGKVSDKIVWMRGKPHLGWSFTSRLIELWAALPMEQVNAGRVKKMLGNKQRSEARFDHAKGMWLKLAILSDWLGRHEAGRAQLKRGGESNVEYEE